MGKAKSKIVNWKDYNKAQVARGSVTFWIDQEAIDTWHCKEHHGGRGRGHKYSDHAIQTALAIKGVFSLSLRTLEGFLNSLFELMELDIRSPDYSCISKRAKVAKIAYRLPANGPVKHLAIDSTGVKVFGEGEWKVKKHGAEQRRKWVKLHLGIDGHTHQVVTAQVTTSSVGDSEVLAGLLRPLRRQIEAVSGDGAYDTKQCYKEVAKKNAKPLFPPRNNAGYWEDEHPRNEAVAQLKAGKLSDWKRESGYHRRSLSETAMYRYKQLINDKLSLRDYNGQVGEILSGVWALNKICTLGMPVRQEIS